ncbi:MAG: hypothetical protein C4527_18470 [Candidatus Omnitrophota bacterium]|nr:MAG: hypothetical protein C4527_18470 [Candidatus Omnitrophota bacterium]
MTMHLFGSVYRHRFKGFADRKSSQSEKTRNDDPFYSLPFLPFVTRTRDSIRAGWSGGAVWLHPAMI